MRSDEGLMKRLKKGIKAIPPIAIPGLFLMRVLSGWRAYRKMLTECPPEEGWRVWFMDYDGSGDTYLTCGYLQSKGLIGERDVFTSSNSPARRVAELFPFGRYVEIRSKAIPNVRVMERFLRQRLNILPLLYESDFMTYSGLMRRSAGIRGIDFMTMLKAGMEVNCGVPYEDGPWEQPEFPYDAGEVETLLTENGLIPGKTVLLAPYAGKGEMCGIPMEFYAELARQLKEKGYTVCTNSVDPQREPPTPGTQPLRIPYRLMRPFCQLAGYFLGLRSGLCDIISQAQCRKVILYAPNMRTDGICSFKEFFSLTNMGLCEDAVEVEAKDGFQCRWEYGLGDTIRLLEKKIVSD